MKNTELNRFIRPLVTLVPMNLKVNLPTVKDAQLNVERNKYMNFRLFYLKIPTLRYRLLTEKWQQHTQNHFFYSLHNCWYQQLVKKKWRKTISNYQNICNYFSMTSTIFCIINEFHSISDVDSWNLKIENELEIFKTEIILI